MITQSIKLSAKAYKSAPIISMMQSDTGRTLQCTFDDFEIPKGATASLYIHRPNETYYEETARVSGQTITIDADQIITTAGYVNCNLKIEKNGEMIQSFPFTIRAVSTSAGSPQTEEKGVTVGELVDEVDALSTAVAGKLDKETITDGEILLESKDEGEGILSLNDNQVNLTSTINDQMSNINLNGQLVYITSNAEPSGQNAFIRLENDEFRVTNWEYDEQTESSSSHTMKYEDGDLTLDNSIVATQDWADGWIDGVLDDYISYGTNTSTDGLSIQNIDNTDEINPTDARLVFGQTARLSTHITNIGGASLELGFNADLSADNGSVIVEASNEGEPATSVTISGNGIAVDAINRPISVTTGDDLQIITDGLSISATTATLNNENIATQDWVTTRIPTPPTTDGTYTLTCTVSNGTATYSWT